MTEGRAIPPAPLLLGLAGLLPFWGLAAALPLAPVAGFEAGALDRALATYAAAILSFLGGLRWGLATVRPDQGAVAPHYAVGVMPALLGWAALALPEPWRLAALGALALGLGPMDRRLVAEALAPPWFGRLRLILSVGAGAALWLGAALGGGRG